MSEAPRVAVVGMAGRFPGAPSLGAYWANLAAGVESSALFSDEALASAGVPPAILADPRCVRRAPSLDDIDYFDAAFFGMGAREAERLDPQQRLLLECACEALEEAGCVPARFDGRIGVYVGVGSNGYLEPVIRGVNVVAELEDVLGNDKDYAATRLSYKLDLRGPSVTVQTACSTSLVAIHLACQSLLSGECDLALAGGAKVRVPQAAAYVYQEGGLLSPDGRCRAFDADASGTVFGSGAGVVALKRLEDALRDGDVIDAIIIGSAVNNDGSSKLGYVAPSEDGQASVIAEALAVSGVDAATIGYVEAHGTGTALGDPIEVAALTRAFRDRGRSQAACALGSVKTNIGHTETAAGVAGLIKVALALKHRALPASLNFRRPNPHIDFARSPFRVVDRYTDWVARSSPLRAGVSSFGIGGTNAHVVLEEAPARELRRSGRRIWVMPISARSPGALSAAAERYAAAVTERGAEPGWLDAASSAAQARRAHHELRRCAVGESPEALAIALRACAQTPVVAAGERPRIAFVYSGQGSQWVGMGRGLLAEDPAFAERLRECDAAIRRVSGFSVLEVLASDLDPRWQRVDVIQPLLFSMQVALSAAWSAAGVDPDAVIGHSMGEVAASVVAGSLSLEDGACVIGTRSRLVSRTAGRGRMALIELSVSGAEAELRSWPGVSIASHHGPETVLVAGATSAVEGLVRSLEGRGVFARLVDVDYASHSAEVDPILGELASALVQLRPRPTGGILQWSTVLGAEITGREVDGGYWVRNLRQPVRFHPSVEGLIERGISVFVEVSPHPVLIPTVERSLRERGAAMGTLRRGVDELRSFAESLAELHTRGADIDWARANRGASFARLPTYPWQRQRYWIAASDRRGHAAARGHTWIDAGLPVASDPGASLWTGKLSVARLPQLARHRVRGTVVIAAAVWLEAALHISRARGGSLALEEVELSRLTALGEGEEAEIQMVSREGGFEGFGSAGQDGWVRAVRGRFGAAREPASRREVDEGRCPIAIDSDTFYTRLQAHGVEHDGPWAAVRRICAGEGEAVAEIALEGPEPGMWAIEPWWIDAALQVLGAAEEASDPRPYLPTYFGRVTLHRRPSAGTSRVEARWRRSGERIEGDLVAVDRDGVWLEIAGARLAPAGRRPSPVDDWLIRLSWVPAPPAEPAPGTRSWLVSSGGPAGQMLARRLGGITQLGSDPVREIPEGCTDVVLLSAAESEDDGSVEGISLAIERGLSRALALVQSLARASLRDPPRLWLVTRGTQGGRPARVAGAPLWGFARSVAHEHPELRCTAIDVPDLEEPSLEALATELRAGSAETQVLLGRGFERFAARIVRASLDATPEPARPARGRPLRLGVARPGDLDSLGLYAASRRAPGPGEVEIEVERAGLNLLDVLIALDVLRDDAPGAQVDPRLGGECSGRVARVGPGVEGLRPGDRVLAVVHDAFRSFVVAGAAMTVRIPDAFGFDQAAGFPIAFLTAHLALSRVARLERGERVLIHAAASGVGLAAVQIARRIGAEIFATAGTEEKRGALRALGVAHVASSRSLDFERELREATGGEGVDVVLNSLSGPFVPASLRLLRRGGRLVEIGKRDAASDAPLALGPFLSGLTFSLFDLRGLLYDRPQIVAEALRELVAAVGAGEIVPLSPEVHPIRSAAQAMRRMAEGRHREKIVLDLRDPDAPVMLGGGASIVRPDASYLVTGGLGALGLAVARRLAERGARHLTLLGRSEPAEGVLAKIAAIEAMGASVRVEIGDVADQSALARAIDASPAPLAGVVHAAGLLDDGILLRQDWSRFAPVLAPKVAGGWNLHLATRARELDFFVLFSSTASLLGAPGQANYSAASAFLDALARHRRAIGLPAVSIQFGSWSQIGLAATRERGGEALARGMRGLSTDEGLAAFEALLSGRIEEVGVVQLDLRQWLESHPLLAASPLLSTLREEGRPKVSKSKLIEQISLAPVGERRAMLERHLRREAARLLRMAPEQIDPRESLVALGLSSLVALEYRNHIEASLGATFPATLIWSHPTVADLTEHIASRLGLPLSGPPPAQAPAPDALHDEIDSLSDDEAEQALLAVLDSLEDPP